MTTFLNNMIARCAAAQEIEGLVQRHLDDPKLDAREPWHIVAQWAREGRVEDARVLDAALHGDRIYDVLEQRAKVGGYYAGLLLAMRKAWEATGTWEDSRFDFQLSWKRAYEEALLLG